MIFRSLKKPSLDGFTKVRNRSLGISVFFSLALTITTYLYFTEQTESNILNNFSDNNVAILIGRVIFAIVMWLTYPMEMFVAREVIVEACFNNRPDRKSMRHIFLTILLAASTYFIALFLGDRLGTVFELTGGVSAAGLAYVFPPACYFKLSKQSWRSTEKLLCIALFTFGICSMILSTFLTIYNSIVVPF